jgi:hypothetical protein
VVAPSANVDGFSRSTREEPDGTWTAVVKDHRSSTTYVERGLRSAADAKAWTEDLLGALPDQPDFEE